MKNGVRVEGAFIKDKLSYFQIDVSNILLTSGRAQPSPLTRGNLAQSWIFRLCLFQQTRESQGTSAGAPVSTLTNSVDIGMVFAWPTSADPGDSCVHFGGLHWSGRLPIGNVGVPPS